MKNYKKGIVRRKSKAVAVVQPEVFADREYLAAVGRRKTSVARVRIYKNGKGLIFVNGKSYEKYFPTVETREVVKSALTAVGQDDKVDVSVMASGGGIRGQAEGTRLGIARALLQLNALYRANLRKSGFLTRDARAKERKKYGLKRARRAPQWSKR